MKRVVSIVGSPRYRDGNTAQFVKKACEAARDSGAEVVDIILYKLNLRGCIDCDACEKKKPLGICKLKEDFPEKLELAKAQTLLFTQALYTGIT